MKQTPRTLKLGESVREIIAEILARRGLGPAPRDGHRHRSPDLSSDLGVANVYVTAHGDQERYAEVLDGSDSAKGRIRTLLGEQITLRFTPELRFFIDESVDEGQRIDQALQNVPPTLADHRRRPRR